MLSTYNFHQLFILDIYVRFLGAVKLVNLQSQQYSLAPTIYTVLKQSCAAIIMQAPKGGGGIMPTHT
jgi:hypothetical protein